MRERINRLAKGIIDSEIPMIETAPNQIYETVRTGMVTKRELIVTSKNNLHIKGLVYSSNYRVSLKSDAFGGLHNRLSYEIDSNYLEDGTIIEGSFYLVTNGGEREIPYSFSVECGLSGKTMGALLTADDFANLAQKDGDTALRLFEYQDFVDAPFMQDHHVRALYDGLKIGPDRKSGLEEFLTALGVKKPVELTVECEDRLYREPENILEDFISVRADGWGYVKLEVRADGDFIEMPELTVTDSQFEGGEYRLAYRIHPKRLHCGRNYGRIFLSCARAVYEIHVEVDCKKQRAGRDIQRSSYRAGYVNYLKLRLSWEGGGRSQEKLAALMAAELDRIEMVDGRIPELCLLRAEWLLAEGHGEQAGILLESCRDEVLATRQDHLLNYCFYQYLKLLAHPDDSQRESLIRLIHKYLEEDRQRHGLFLLLLRLDSRLLDNPGTLLSMMKKQHQVYGCRSPLLYLEACTLLNEKPDLLRGAGPFEIQVLNFGSKYGVIHEPLAAEAAKLGKEEKYFHSLFFRILVGLYRKYKSRDLLEAVCALLIKGERRDAEAFVWYEQGVRAGLSLTRLYEYFLYALPEDYDRLMPREILLYFSYGDELDAQSRAALFSNIIKHMKPEEELYRDYEREIEKFAMEQLFQSRIDRYLAAIYEHMIYQDVIDLPVARVLPAALRSHEIKCSNPYMKYVIVRCEEVTGEMVFLLENGSAYAPLFSEHSLILFQDSFGNRYALNDCTVSRVMDRPLLEKRCYEIDPTHPMLRLKRCGEILSGGITCDDEALELERTLDGMNLTPLFQKKILSDIIVYYQKKAEQEDSATEDTGGGYLARLDKSVLTAKERAGVCETLIARNYMQEAFDIIREYGPEGIRTKRLMKLCAKMILQNMFDEDRLLLHIAFSVFQDGMTDSVILDYLCEHFNGSTSAMYKVLLQGVGERVETYDLEERLLAQMLFTGSVENIDKVFELYISRKRTVESIVRAYFTAKCAEYFLEKGRPKDQVFSYLEGAVNGTEQKDRMPAVYLLALTKYYSGLQSLDEDQRKLCSELIGILLEQGMRFPYFKTLSRFISIPADIMDKGMIQYIGDKNSRVECQVRILPEEEEYHSEDMRRMYQGIFVKQKVLFEGEIMEYRIFELVDGSRILKAQGSITSEISQVKSDESRFDCLNDMGLCLTIKEEDRLKKKMKEYMLKNAAARELFGLM